MNFILSQNFKICKQRIIYLQNIHRFLSLKPLELSYNVNEPKNDLNEPPILIYHGLFGSKMNWRSLSNQIAIETNRRVFTFDVRNHGDSPWTEKLDFPSMTADLISFLNKQSIEKATFIGHSLGGRAMFHLAMSYPERIEKLVAVDIGLREIGERKNGRKSFPNSYLIKAMRDALNNIPKSVSLGQARKLVDERLSESVKEEFVRSFLLMSLKLNKEKLPYWRFNLDAIERFLESGALDEITFTKPFMGQTMVIYGQLSNYVTQEDIILIKQWFPNCVFEKIPNGNHYLHIQEKDLFLYTLINFLK